VSVESDTMYRLSSYELRVIFVSDIVYTSCNFDLMQDSSSLDKLALYLSKDKLRIMQRKFCYLSTENFNLLTRKGIFPYEYIDCFEKLEDTCLPPRESFYSSLTGDNVSEDNYAHAVNVWQRIFIRTLGEYSDLYLNTQMSCCWQIFLKTFAVVVSRVTGSIPRIIIHYQILRGT